QNTAGVSQALMRGIQRKGSSMKTDNKNSEKDLNANPHSRWNTHEPTGSHSRIPESQQTRQESEKGAHKKKNEYIELLANDVEGTVSSRDTSTSPDDIAGVSDIDHGMRRSRRNK